MVGEIWGGLFFENVLRRRGSGEGGRSNLEDLGESGGVGEGEGGDETESPYGFPPACCGGSLQRSVVV